MIGRPIAAQVKRREATGLPDLLQGAEAEDENYLVDHSTLAIW